MFARWSWGILAALIAVSAAPAQTAAPRFQWKIGQVLLYRVTQTTTAAEVVDGARSDSATKLANTKRWQVVGVDPAGVATLQLSIAALRVETTTPKKEVLLYDSAQPDKSDPQLKEQLSRYVGPPLAVLRIDCQGKLIEVKECKFGPATRFESELPFLITLPVDALKPAQSWERAYQITLEPPQGTGEKYDAVQQYVCKNITGTAATIGLTTTVKKLPDAVADQVPLLHLQPEGEVVFDLEAGRLMSAHLTIKKELKAHQGADSSYAFTSDYTEQYAGSNP